MPSTLSRIPPMLSCQRDLVHLPEGLHYLNCAYLGPLLKAVEEVGIAVVGLRRDPEFFDAMAWFSDTGRVREHFSELVNCDLHRVAIVPAVSYAVATVARNLRLRPGQNVVVARAQFPSNVYGWMRLCAESGATLRTVAPPEAAAGRGEGWNTRA